MEPFLKNKMNLIKKREDFIRMYEMMSYILENKFEISLDKLTGKVKIFYKDDRGLVNGKTKTVVLNNAKEFNNACLLELDYAFGDSSRVYEALNLILPMCYLNIKSGDEKIAVSDILDNWILDKDAAFSFSSDFSTFAKKKKVVLKKQTEQAVNIRFAVLEAFKEELEHWKDEMYVDANGIIDRYSCDRDNSTSELDKKYYSIGDTLEAIVVKISENIGVDKQVVASNLKSILSIPHINEMKLVGVDDRYRFDSQNTDQAIQQDIEYNRLNQERFNNIFAKCVVGTYLKYGEFHFTPFYELSKSFDNESVYNHLYDRITRRYASNTLRNDFMTFMHLSAFTDLQSMIFNALLSDCLKNNVNVSIVHTFSNGKTFKRDIRDYLTLIAGPNFELPLDIRRVPNFKEFEKIMDSFVKQYGKDYIENNKNVFENSKINNVEVKKSMNQVIGSVNGLGDIKAKYSETLEVAGLHIELATQKDERHKINQDAVGNATRELSDGSTAVLNVVCDGAGGMASGEVYSSYVLAGVQEWFNRVGEKVFYNYEYFKESLTTVVQELCKGLGQNGVKGGATTLAMSVTTPNYTYTANVGDSLIYMMDQDGMVSQLSTDHSVSAMNKKYGEDEHIGSYEEVRLDHNPQIALAISDSRDGVRVSFNRVNNEGQRIIISSDGVTDLISEEHFNELLRTGATAEEIVAKALLDPDENGYKKSDDISCIVYDLPGGRVRGGR